MKKYIKDLPDEIDPVVLIYDKMSTCPWCGHQIKYENSYQYMTGNNEDVLIEYTDRRDKNGKHHDFFESKNQYEWVKLVCRCKGCGTQWETDWFPQDREMLKIEV